MRKSLIAAAALVAAAPAIAQPAYDEDLADEARTEILDPREVGEMARMMDRLVGAVMDLPIGGIAQALDPEDRGGVRRDETLRDMAERDDPYAEERIRAGIHGATRGIGVMSEALARMMPVLQRSLEEVSRSIETAVDEAVPGRRY
jgi:hypothetical protein